MSERPTPPTTSISDTDRAADDGFPHIPALEEWRPEPLTPTDPERSEEPLREERQDEQASVKSR
jgi:hypothetical protein